MNKKDLSNNQLTISNICHEVKRAYKEKEIDKGDLFCFMGCLQYYFDDFREMLESESENNDILTLKGKAIEIWEFCKEERDSESCLEGTCPLECYCKNNQIQDLEFDYNDEDDIKKIERAYNLMKASQEDE